MSRNPFIRSEYVTAALSLFCLALALVLVARWVVPPIDAQATNHVARTGPGGSSEPLEGTPGVAAGVRHWDVQGVPKPNTGADCEPPVDVTTINGRPALEAVAPTVRVVCTVQWADAPEWGVKSKPLHVGESFRVSIQSGPIRTGGELECVVHP